MVLAESLGSLARASRPPCGCGRVRFAGRRRYRRRILLRRPPDPELVLAEIAFVAPGDPVPARIDLNGFEKRLVLQQAEAIESEERRTVIDLLNAVEKGHPQAPLRQR